MNTGYSTGKDKTIFNMNNHNQPTVPVFIELFLTIIPITNQND